MPTFDVHANFAVSTIATAPSPATTGLSLTLSSGTGALFPASGSFDVVIWPYGAQPLSTNAEIARVASVSGDTLTLSARGPQTGDPGGINRTIVAGDQIQLASTMKLFTDLEAAVNAVAPPPLDVPAGTTYLVPSNAQVLYKLPISVEGTIEIQGSGVLISV